MPVHLWLFRAYRGSPDGGFHRFLAILVDSRTTVTTSLLRLVPVRLDSTTCARSCLGNASALTIDSPYALATFLLIKDWTYAR